MAKESKISERRLRKYVGEMYESGIKFTYTLKGQTKELREDEAFKLMDAYINHYRGFDVCMVFSDLVSKFQ